MALRNTPARPAQVRGWPPQFNACKLGFEGIVRQAARLALPLRPLARLAQDEEPGRAGREARGGGGVG
jgi:hypothetical protein